MTQSQKDTHRLRNFIALLSLVGGLISASAWLVNQPWVLSRALSLANAHAKWQIGIGRLTFHPLAGDIVAKDVIYAHRTENKKFFAGGIDLSINPLGLLRGKISIDNLRISGARLSLPSSRKPAADKERRRIDIAKLILLRNVEVEDGKIEQMSISFGDDMNLAVDEVRISMKSGLLGKTSIGIRTDGLSATKGDRAVASAGSLSLKASTNLRRWHGDFPYLNSVDGRLSVGGIVVGGLPIDKADAGFSLHDDDLKIEELEVLLGERRLSGRISANLASQAFDLSVEIPEPISLPYIGKSMITFDTAGKLSGKISLNGSGFIPSKTSGRGTIDVEHRFDASPDNPVRVLSSPSWRNGVVDIGATRVSVGDSELAVSGIIDVPGKGMDLEANGKQFPIEHVFDKFRNPHLKKIFGPTDVTATFKGWAKKFESRMSGDTLGGGWKPITAFRVKTDLVLTYDSLELNGIIVSGIKKTGEASLKIAYGPKIGDLIRKKDITFEATLSEHPLVTSFAAYGLKGHGSGEISLHGPSTSFDGKAVARIDSGTLHSFSFNRASADIALSNKKLVFSNLVLSIPKSSSEMPGEIVVDVGDGKTRFYGKPSPQFEIDATYQSKDGRWNIAKMSLGDPEDADMRIDAKGSISGGGPIDMSVAGRYDLDALRPFMTDIRGGKGPVDVDLKVRGSTKAPSLFGKVDFNKNELVLRGAQLALEDLEGSIVFAGQRIEFDGIKAMSDDGTLGLSGWLNHDSFRPASADLTLTGKELRYRAPDRDLSIEFEGTLYLKGQFPSPLLSGDITVLDGKYTKDFTIIDAISGKKGGKAPAKISETMFNPQLNLRIKNTGDVEIDNNVGNIWLTINVDVKGTRRKPAVAGSIATSEGEVHYLGMRFDITKGFMEFRENYEDPYMEVYAQKELNIYSINLDLHGPTSNLTLDLSATSPTGPIEKRDVVSLILFGITEQDRDAIAQQGSAQYASSLAARSASSVMERPISKFTHLDIFRLESTDSGTAQVSRLYLGKQLSDRLSVKFSTDINSNDAVQTVIAEYLLTDDLLLKGSRSTDNNAEIGGLLRFRMR